MAVTSNPAPVAPTSQNALHTLLCEVLPPQGTWSDDAYLGSPTTATAWIELTDGLVEELPVPTFTHQPCSRFSTICSVPISRPAAES